MCYSRRIGSSWTENSWRCLTRRRLTSPLRNILWSFLTFLACRIVIMYFHSFPLSLPRIAIARAYSKYAHTWYTQGVHYWLNHAATVPTKRGGMRVSVCVCVRVYQREKERENSVKTRGSWSEGDSARGESEVGGCYCYHCLNRLAVSRARLEGNLT